MFTPTSTPAHDIHKLALFVISVCAAIFVGLVGCSSTG
jgi:hypothetical protein